MAKIEKAKKYFAAVCLTLILASQPGVSNFIQPYAPEAKAQSTGGTFSWTLRCGTPDQNYSIACD
ncbi:MAG: hypothetical protein PHO54_04920, partial [Candidatus Peribacteraceae bacterium]|nr:hypothetical protein [Candidatus Peribacteraceae bacterium]